MKTIAGVGLALSLGAEAGIDLGPVGACGSFDHLGLSLGMWSGL